MKKNFETGSILGLLCVLFLASGPRGVRAQATVQFTEVASAVGINVTDIYFGTSNHSLGALWIDYDNDNWPDLFLVNGIDLPAHLYHNDGGTFSKVDHLLPILPNVELSGAAFADYDNDGDQDIYIFASNENVNTGFTHPDGPANILLKNMWVENGSRTVTGQSLFIDVAADAGVDNLAPVPLGEYPGYRSLTGGWLDYNRDGCVDLFVGQMAWDAGGFPWNRNTFYENNCDGTFTDVTASSGVDTGTDSLMYRPTLAFIGAHLNDDLWPDMYVVNVQDVSPFHFDFIYMNNGGTGFTEVADDMPFVGDDSGAGMGIDVADIDHDGDWDIYITDIEDPGNEPVAEGNVLYLSNGDGTWSENVSVAAGVKGKFSWGTNFLDVDQDGYEDLFVGATNTDLLYHNDGDGTFTDISAAAGITLAGSARGTAVADFDRDGDLDILVVNNMVTQSKGLRLYRNDTIGAGNRLQVRLMATQSNRSAIGTMLKAEANGVTYMRQIKGGSSVHSQSDMVAHFGLGDATTVGTLTVQWPSGMEQTFTNLDVNQCIVLVEGSPAVHTCLVPFLEITSPGPGDVWEQGSTHTITWVGNIVGTVRLTLYKGGIIDRVLVTRTRNDGEYEWTVPMDADGSDYQIRIANFVDPFIADNSDVFSITPPGPPAITVKTPNGGEDWEQGTLQNITWSSNLSGAVRLSLYKGGVLDRIIDGSTDGDGNYGWTVPTDADGSDYQIRITSRVDPSVSDNSDGFFSIVPPGPDFITVTAPNGGEVWEQGSLQNITWTSKITGDVRISLYKGGVQTVLIAPNTADDGVYEWTVPTDADGADYQIRISSFDAPAIADKSDGMFSIVAPGVQAARSVTEGGPGLHALATTVPDHFSLGPSYPNPFNPATVIAYGLAAEAPVTLVVYDVLGREVRRLVDRVQPAGVYQVRFDAGALPSGMYLYRLQAGAFTETRTMLLMR